MIGKFLNQYCLEEVVGQGGMGVVYRALDLNLQRTVAVKLLSASFRDDPGFIARFRQEARIQGGLNHPNIATLFDFFLWEDMPVAVMEFIKGETLRSRVDRSGPIPAHIALPIFIQALRGVAAGHKSGIVHRDLKPGNLMMIALYSRQHVDINRYNTPAPEVGRLITEALTPVPPSPLHERSGLTGTWTGTYVDRSGRALLRLLNLQIQHTGRRHHGPVRLRERRLIR